MKRSILLVALFAIGLAFAPGCASSGCHGCNKMTAAKAGCKHCKPGCKCPKCKKAAAEKKAQEGNK